MQGRFSELSCSVDHTVVDSSEAVQMVFDTVTLGEYRQLKLCPKDHKIIPLLEVSPIPESKLRKTCPHFALFVFGSVTEHLAHGPNFCQSDDRLFVMNTVISWARKFTVVCELSEGKAIYVCRKVHESLDSNSNSEVGPVSCIESCPVKHYPKDGQTEDLPITIDEDTDDSSKRACNRAIVMYPKVPGSDAQISISRHDIKCLSKDAFINDVIIGFYCRYLWNEGNLTEEARLRYHIFDSLFFEKLVTTSKQITETPNKREDRLRQELTRKWGLISPFVGSIPPKGFTPFVKKLRKQYN